MEGKDNTVCQQGLFEKIASGIDADAIQEAVNLITSLPEVPDEIAAKEAQAKDSGKMKWRMLNLADGRHQYPEYEHPFVLVCDDVGTIVSATVNQWTDNYPYFRVNVLTTQGYFECGRHKYSYMGCMHGIGGHILYGDLIHKFLPKRIPYFEGGIQHGDFTR